MVGEVVILIDEEIDLQSGPVAHVVKILQLFYTPVLCLQGFPGSTWQEGSIRFAERVEPRIAMGIHLVVVIAQVGIDDGEVEIEDEILVVVGGGVLSYVQIPIQLFELVLLVDVVIVVQHRHGETLAETARTDEEEVLVGFFHFLDEPCLVHIVTVILADSHKVHHTIRNAFCLLLACLLFHLAAVFLFNRQS